VEKVQKKARTKRGQAKAMLTFSVFEFLTSVSKIIWKVSEYWYSSRDEGEETSKYYFS